MSEKEFLEWIDRIIAFRERKGLPSITAAVWHSLVNQAKWKR
jgi:hypothetical protein